MRALTTQAEREIPWCNCARCQKLKRSYSVTVVVVDRLVVAVCCASVGMFCFGNLMKECGVVDRLSDTTQNALINIVMIFLGLG